MSLLDKVNNKNIPQHVAIIMDGNGRWAKARDLERSEGHREGIETIEKVVDACTQANVKYLTIYAFSVENWLRPEDEVNTLMDLLVYFITKETPKLLKNGIRLQTIGETERLPERTRNALYKCMEETASGEKLTLVVALSYSSRWELTKAAKDIAADVKNGVLGGNSITEETINNYLATKNMPDVDLLIRTGGEIRISNFMLWQASYAELYFTDTYWPDFDEECLYEAILYFQKKERRFGKISEQLEKENQ